MSATPHLGPGSIFSCLSPLFSLENTIDCRGWYFPTGEACRARSQVSGRFFSAVPLLGKTSSTYSGVRLWHTVTVPLLRATPKQPQSAKCPHCYSHSRLGRMVRKRSRKKSWRPKSVLLSTTFPQQDCRKAVTMQGTDGFVSSTARSPRALCLL